MSTARELAQAVADRLAKITTAAGYKTDIGLRVFRGRVNIDIDGQVPCVSMIEADDEVISSTPQIAEYKLRDKYHLDAFTQCDPDHPNDAAHDMLEDMKQALFWEDLTMGGKAFRLRYEGRNFAAREDGQGMVSTRVTISIERVEYIRKP